MNYQKLSKVFMLTVVLAGLLCVAWAAINLPFTKLDIELLVLVCFTIGFGSRISVQIPRFKSHVSVSDTFIFLALLLYGGEVAIVLSAVEAFLSSWRFCNKKLTVFFNAAAFAVSTTCVVLVLGVLGLRTEEQLHGHAGNYEAFFIALSAIAFTQFFVNTILASLHDSLKNAIPFFETWKSKYLWTFLTYLVGALGAGILVQLSERVGFGVILAVLPVILFVYLTYRMYLKNVEMSILQAETAKEYANVLEERTEALRESEQRFRIAFNYAPIGIALVTPAGKWVKVNHALCNLLGYDAEEFMNSDFQSMIYPDDLAVTLSKIHSLLTGQISNCQMEQRYVHKTGRMVWASWSVSAVGDIKAENANIIFQIQDITGRKIAEQKLQHEATHDALTGLPNRAYFMTRLTEALQKSQRHADHHVGVLFIDLDRFKYVNDSLGHLIGDRLLVAISKRLHDCMRPSDTVARLGGDEFTILVEGNYDLAEVTRIAERIQQKFSVPFEIQGHEIYSSASIGILHASETHLTSEDMMRDADTAMYQAKRAGKARHEVFDHDMYAAAKETLRLETDLRRAVEKDEFTVLYQPIFSLITGEIKGVEALARWQHAELGEISPAKFIPLAEEIGWIDALSEKIMRKSCSEIGSVYLEMEAGENLKLSINLSCRQFANADLVSRITNMLSETEFPAANLKLEITESVFFEYQERAIEMLHKLRGTGIAIDVDDFGTGYSNLSYLVRLPISTLKIDRSFISPINSEGANTEIVRTIIAMARNLGLRVIAEGIETEAQLDALKQLECDEGQGFLLGKPMSAAEIRDFLFERSGSTVPQTSFDFSIQTLQ